MGSDLKVSEIGLKVKINIRAQAKHGLWDSNAKIGNIYMGAAKDESLVVFGLKVIKLHRIDGFEYFFSKMVKFELLDHKGCQ